MGQGVGFAPGPGGGVAAQGGLQVRQGGAPDDLQGVGAGLDGGRVFVVPPGRCVVSGQQGQGAVQRPGAQQVLELHGAHLVCHGATGQLVHQLAEHGGRDAVGPKTAVPVGQALQHGALGGFGNDLVQDWNQGRQQAWTVAGLHIKLQGLAGGRIPPGCIISQAFIQTLTPVGQVVVTGHGYPAVGLGLVVGRDDVAAPRIFLLGVVAVAVKAPLVRFARAAVQDKAGVHVLGPNGQLGRRPPANVTRCAAPHDIEPRRMDFAGSSAGLEQGVGPVKFVKGVQDRVFGFQERPPHGHRCGAQAVLERVSDDRSVWGAPQRERDRLFALDHDFLGAALQLDPLPLVPDLVGVGGVDLLGDQVQVVVLEHGQGPAKLRVVPQQGGGVECLVVAVQLKAWCRQVGLVPDRGG